MLGEEVYVTRCWRWAALLRWRAADTIKSGRNSQSWLFRAGGVTIVLVTHEHDIAEYAHRVVNIKDGVVERDEVKR